MSIKAYQVFYDSVSRQLKDARVGAKNVKTINVGDGFVEIIHDSEAITFVPMHRVYEVYLEPDGGSKC